MVFNRPDVGGGGFVWVIAGVCCIVFAVGAFIGYHSIYRSISVAMLPPPHATSPL